MSSEQQALVAPPSGNGFLELIEKVVTNPDISVEKVKALLEMQLQVEDRRAKAEFDTAMISAQAEIQALKWDKFNASNQSRNVSYPKIEKMVKPVREKHGFSQNYDTEPSANPNEMIFCADVSHVGGHTRRYRLPMPIDGSGPKGGGVMTKCQAVGNGTSYAMRYLDKMIWNIPMLVDKDDNDGAEQYEKINKKQVADLRALADEATKNGETGADVIKAFCAYFQLDKLENLPASKYQSAVNSFKRRKAQAA